MNNTPRIAYTQELIDKIRLSGKTMQKTAEEHGVPAHHVKKIKAGLPVYIDKKKKNSVLSSVTEDGQFHDLLMSKRGYREVKFKDAIHEINYLKKMGTKINSHS